MKHFSDLLLQALYPLLCQTSSQTHLPKFIASLIQLSECHIRSPYIIQCHMRTTRRHEWYTKYGGMSTGCKQETLQQPLRACCFPENKRTINNEEYVTTELSEAEPEDRIDETTPWLLVRKRTLPTERPPFIDEI
jgi:hypothetical protein